MPESQTSSDPKICKHQGKVWTNEVELVDGGRGQPPVRHQHSRCTKCGLISRCFDQEVILQRA